MGINGKDKLTEYDKCKNIKNNLLIAMGENINYKNLTDKKRIENIDSRVKALKEKHGCKDVDPTKLTLKEMNRIGFGTWSDKTKSKLIPLWLFPFLIEEFESETINGEKVKLKKDMDDDHRMGFLAFLVKPTDIIITRGN